MWNSVINFTFARERTSLLIYILVRKENGALEKNYLTLPEFKPHSAAHRVISHSSMAADAKHLMLRFFSSTPDTKFEPKPLSCITHESCGGKQHRERLVAVSLPVRGGSWV